MQYRTVRSYPRKMAGNLLGYVGEVSQATIDKDAYYKSGDYLCISPGTKNELLSWVNR